MCSFGWLPLKLFSMPNFKARTRTHTHTHTHTSASFFDFGKPSFHVTARFGQFKNLCLTSYTLVCPARWEAAGMFVHVVNQMFQAWL